MEATNRSVIVLLFIICVMALPVNFLKQFTLSSNQKRVNFGKLCLSSVNFIMIMIIIYIIFAQKLSDVLWFWNLRKQNQKLLFKKRNRFEEPHNMGSNKWLIM
jgi:large-conductance mechanosensitive channel